MSDKLSKVIRYLMLPLLCAAVIVCYFPTLTSAFHLDDFEIVLNNNLTDAPVLPLIKKYPTRWLVFFSYWLNLRPAVTGFFARFCSPEEAPPLKFGISRLGISSMPYDHAVAYSRSSPLLL